MVSMRIVRHSQCLHRCQQATEHTHTAHLASHRISLCFDLSFLGTPFQRHLSQTITVSTRTSLVCFDRVALRFFLLQG